MMQGKGFHAQIFDRYEDVPGDVMAKIVETAQKDKEKEAAWSVLFVQVYRADGQKAVRSLLFLVALVFF